MNTDETLYQQIDEYLQNKLSEASKKEFELMLNGNEDLKNEVLLRKLSNRLIINNRLLEVKKLSAETKKGISVKRKFLRILGIMFVVGTLAGTFFLFFIPEKKEEVKVPVTPALKPKAITSSETKVKKKVVVPVTQSKLKVPIDNNKEIPVTEQIIQESKTIVEEKKASEILSVETVESEEKIPVPLPAPEKRKVTTDNKKSCTNVLLDATISSSGTCENNQNGNILVSEIKGGTEPYNWVILSEKSNEQIKQNELPAGVYSVLIRDKNNCEKKIEHVTVKEIECLEEIRFNPFLGETWELVPASSAGILTIYEKGGNSYYKARIEAGNAFIWDGKSSKGEINHGLFIFTIEYEDETRKQGEIVILR